MRMLKKQFINLSAFFLSLVVLIFFTQFKLVSAANCATPHINIQEKDGSGPVIDDQDSTAANNIYVSAGTPSCGASPLYNFMLFKWQDSSQDWVLVKSDWQNTNSDTLSPTDVGEYYVGVWAFDTTSATLSSGNWSSFYYMPAPPVSVGQITTNSAELSWTLTLNYYLQVFCPPNKSICTPQSYPFYVYCSTDPSILSTHGSEHEGDVINGILNNFHSDTTAHIDASINEYEVEGLNPNTHYYCRVRGDNSQIGDVYFSTGFQTLGPTDTPAPSAIVTPIPASSNPPVVTNTVPCSGATHNARATGLVSSPYSVNGSKFNSKSGCAIDPKTAFRPDLIPDFNALENLYYNQK